MGLFRNTAYVLTTSVVGVPLGIATSVVLARFLSLEDRGHYAVALSIATTLGIFSNLGWVPAVIYRVRNAGSDPALAIMNSALAAFTSSGAAIVLCLLLQDRVAVWFLKGAPLFVLYLALAMVPFQQLGNFASAVARAIDRFGIQSRYTLSVRAGLLLALTVALVVLDGALVEALTAAVAVYVVATLLTVLSVIRHTGLSVRLRFAEIRETLRVGSKAWVYWLAGSVHERADVFVLAYLLQDSSQIALYAIAVGVVEFLKMVPEAIGGAVLPQLVGVDSRQAGRLAAAALRHGIFWVLGTAGVAAAAASFVIPLVYGPDYAGSVLPFFVLLPGVVFLTAYRLLGRFFFAVDRQSVNIAVQGGSVVLNIALNFLWIPRFGILGAALSSLVSYSVQGVIMIALFSQGTGIGLREALVFQRADVEPYRTRAVNLWRRFAAGRSEPQR